MSQQKTQNQLKMLSLRKLLAHCLQKKGTVYSAEALFHDGKQVRLPEIVREASETEFILAEIFGERFERLLADLADYGRRREYEFDEESDDPAEAAAQRWLNGDLSGLRLKPGRGKRSDPHQMAGRRLTFGECLARLVTEAKSQDLSRNTLWWLSWHLDYSLDWLLFGAGTIAKSSFHDTCDPTIEARNPEPGADDASAYAEIAACLQTISELKAMRGTTTWRGADWNWLMNGKTHTTSQCKSPTLPLCARCVSAWNIQPVMPEMPDLLAFIDWLYVYILREFFVVQPLAKGDWRQQLFETIARGKNKVLILLGTTPQAGTQYRLGKATPGNAVVKLAFFIQLITRRFGRSGFLQYLAMVNDEARARGFSSLLEVMARRTWRDDRNADAAEGPDGEDSGGAGEAGGGDAGEAGAASAPAGKDGAPAKAPAPVGQEDVDDLLFVGGDGGEDAAEAISASAARQAGASGEDAAPGAPGGAEDAGAPSAASGKAAKTPKDAKADKTARTPRAAKADKTAKDAKEGKEGKTARTPGDAKAAKPAKSPKTAKTEPAAGVADALPDGGEGRSAKPAARRKPKEADAPQADPAPRQGQDAGLDAGLDAGRDAGQATGQKAVQDAGGTAGQSLQPSARRRRPAAVTGFLRRVKARG